MPYFKIVSIEHTDRTYGTNEDMKRMIGKVVSLELPSHPDQDFRYAGCFWLYKDTIRCDVDGIPFLPDPIKPQTFDPKNLVGESNEERT